MQLGIDFGTTRTIVASVDRGNYPVVSFPDEHGDACDHIPSVVALRDGELVYGFEAERAHADGAPLLRSFKRALASAQVSGASTLRLGDREVGVLDLVTGFLAAVRVAIVTGSTLAGDLAPGEALEAAVAVPAHAHSAQRFLTLEAFRRAGFDVRALINEPSAAGFEYTHRQGRTLTSRRTRVIVYDLGGGTFDASLVKVDDRSHEVLDSLGVNSLGGDDFDEILAGCALAEAGTRREDLSADAWQELLDDARTAKEALAPQSRRIALDVAGRSVVLPVETFYAAAAPLVEQTVDALAPLVHGLGDGNPDLAEIAGLYLVGGGSGLPLVPRVLRDRFGRRVHRSPHPSASTAIGLAIAADDAAGYSLSDRLSRGFGVFREADAGAALSFDALLDRQQRVSLDGDIVVTRRYRPAHNVGWFRFVEYSRVDADRVPRGDLVPFGEIVFPFEAGLRDHADLRSVPVERRDSGPLIEERYVIDRHGIVAVHLTDLESGYTLSQSLTSTG